MDVDIVKPIDEDYFRSGILLYQRNTQSPMKKKLILALIISCFSITQSPVFAANDQVLWGVKGSVDIEIPGKWRADHNSFSMYRPGAGFTIGPVCNIYLGKGFYFEPGVSLFYSEYRYKDLIIEAATPEVDPKNYKWGVQVPLVVGTTFEFTDKFVMNLYTGPQFRYAFAGGTEYKNRSLVSDLNGSLDLWNIQRRLDLSWKVGLGFPTPYFNIAVEGDVGLTNLLKDDVSFNEYRLGLGITYYF